MFTGQVWFPYCSGAQKTVKKIFQAIQGCGKIYKLSDNRDALNLSKCAVKKKKKLNIVYRRR